MIERLRRQLEKALAQRDEFDRAHQSEPTFASRLALESMSAHVDELRQQVGLLDTRPVIELVEMRLKAPGFEDGSIPLRLIARLAEDFRQMLGYAALRLTRGGTDRKRVPDDLYDELDLRLSAVLPGSSRLVVTTSANRDLLNDGLAKGALGRFFRVLQSGGGGESFLEAITDFGPSSSKRLRDLLHLISSAPAEVDLSWRYAGETVDEWYGTHKALSDVTHALDVTEINSREETVLAGSVELLSKRERIHLRTDLGRTVRVLFPMRLLPRVAELHLDQLVRLRCSVTETLNPYTGEAATFYE
ncbi:MAG: hypothetical protein ABL962_17705, partial [Fimbriimonadaceae bacterium]